jgi:hypothetical protein
MIAAMYRAKLHARDRKARLLIGPPGGHLGGVAIFWESTTQRCIFGALRARSKASGHASRATSLRPSSGSTCATFHASSCTTSQRGTSRSASSASLGARYPRVESTKGALAYLPDHEPALGVRRFPLAPDWTSGFALAKGVGLLVHDAQYSTTEYADRVGWGHSAIEPALAFARLAGVRRLVTFHHNPAHRDADIERLTGEAVAAVQRRSV